MNFHEGGPSRFSFYASSSSSDDEDQPSANIQNEMNRIDEQQTVLSQLINSATVVSNYFQESDNLHRQGSITGHVVINRDRLAAELRLYNDYFSESPMYNESMFKRRFRMSRRLFLRIMESVQQHDNYFVQKVDALGRPGLSPYQKITAAMRILAYGMAADSTDEYIKIGESTAIESLKRFCRAVVEVFGDWYLRSPNVEDIERILLIGKQRGFPGMLGSLDCMHWKWKNCPTGWAGQYAGRSRKPTIILEAVADYELWIWHAYFGLPGSNNDVNVLSKSHLFVNLANGVAPPAKYVIQGKECTMGYYLADGIYPKWPTLVQTIHNPQGPKKKYFAARQESCRKDVERAFGVLQSKWAIITGPARVWRKQVLHDIMTTCIIMHNMIIEDERELNVPVTDYREAPIPDVEMAHDEHVRFQEFLARHRKIKDKSAHYALRDALIDHLLEEYSNSEY
ncbi:protein ANTAGONIST OF LIKE HETEROCHROMATIN PROTEIN 1-like [Primulina huaijiensis]|uniref:protein ANTAGONIST OF LIKE HETEROCHROMATIN PROTEIN 1-like n=1 Tax=Primulina huaijiensis TaxID=1492673 RepID=UPI003CC7831C